MTPNGRVLIVDDQPVNVKLLKIKMEREGMCADAATSGQECLDYLETNTPDVILLDIMMPVMDGIETCRRIKANPKTCFVPVIFITAKTSKDSRMEGFSVGAVDYITKPIDLNETHARVKAHIEASQAFRKAVMGHPAFAQLEDYLKNLRTQANEPNAVMKGIENMEAEMETLRNFLNNQEITIPEAEQESCNS